VPVYVRNAERWEVRQEGLSLITRVGSGPEHIERFASQDVAWRQFVQRVREHIDLGFVPEQSDDEDEDGEAPKPAPPARGEELEAAILERPEDRSVYAVYGDWLLAHGNPWGELMMLQLNGKKNDAEGCLEKLMPLLFDDTFEAARYRDLAVTAWRWGFVRGARLRGQDGASLKLHELIPRFLRLPIARALQRLELGEGTSQRCVEALGFSPRMPLLREVSVGTSYGGPLDLGPIRDWLEHVETLELSGQELTMGHEAPARLKHLAVKTNIQSLDALIGALHNNNTVTTLDLTSCDLGPSTLGLCAERLRALKTLVLEGKDPDRILMLSEATMLLWKLECVRFTAVRLETMRQLATVATAFSALPRIEVSCAPALKSHVARALADLPNVKLR
jgi:uncharacterized protein (TIGR02996 family)